MKQSLLGGLQIFLTSFMCAMIGMPQATFTSLQHFMLNEHIYEDRCIVTSASTVAEVPYYCLQSRTAYVNVFNAAGLGFAIAVIPAYYSVRYFGFSFTNICCCLVLAAGSLLITGKPEDQWVSDRFAYGYAIISMSAPFAILNAFRAISTFPASSTGRVSLMICFLAILQTGPFFSSLFSAQFSENTLEDLFRNLLWVPYLWLLMTLLIMPLSDSTQELQPDILVKQLKSHFHIGGKFGKLFPLEAFDTRSFESVVWATDPCDHNHKTTHMRAIFSRSFFSLFAAYFANSLPIDLMLVGGEARAEFHEELSVWTQLTVISPLLAAASLPLLVWLSSSVGVRKTMGLTCLFSIMQTLCQFWSVRVSWTVASLLVGSCQSALVWTTALCFVKCVRADLFGLTSLAFMIGTVALKILVLPYIDVSVEFDQSIYGYNPYLIVLLLQVLTSLGLWHTLRLETLREDRFYLELEARSAFDNEL